MGRSARSGSRWCLLASCRRTRVRAHNRGMTPDRPVTRADRPVRTVRRPSDRVPSQQGVGPDAAAVLDMQRTVGNGATSSLLVPVQRQKKAVTGVAKYGTTRLTTRLPDMMPRGV